VVLLTFLIGIAAVVAATIFCVVRGVQFWRQARRTGGALSSEVAKFEERSARTARLLEEADRANEDLQAARERLSADRARLQVLLDALERAKKRTRWLRAFLPVR
jgi:Tfp pilus assembly protein PilN